MWQIPGIDQKLGMFHVLYAACQHTGAYRRMSVVCFSYKACEAINKLHISVDGTEIIGAILLLCRSCGRYTPIRITVDIISLDYTLAADDYYALTIFKDLAGANLVNGKDQGAIRFMSEIPSRKRVSGFVMAGQPATTFRPYH